MFIVAPLANSVPIHILRRFPSPFLPILPTLRFPCIFSGVREGARVPLPLPRPFPSLPVLPTLRFPCRLSCFILLPVQGLREGSRVPSASLPIFPTPCLPCIFPVQGSREDADVAARELQERLWDAEQRARTAQVWGS